MCVCVCESIHVVVLFYFMYSFPLDLLPVLALLRPLSSDQLSAQSVFGQLHKLSGLTEAVSSRQLYGCVSPGQDEGTWMLKKPRTLYGHGELSETYPTLMIRVHRIVSVLGPREAFTNVEWKKLNFDLKILFTLWVVFLTLNFLIVYCYFLAITPVKYIM